MAERDQLKQHTKFSWGFRAWHQTKVPVFRKDSVSRCGISQGPGNFQSFTAVLFGVHTSWFA